MLAIDLSGRAILVTGGSRGIGAGIVRLAGRAGARVVFTHTGNPARAADVQALLRTVADEGGWARAEAVDALDAAAVNDLARRMAAEFGAIHGLVCNAGGYEPRDATAVADQEWRSTIDWNLTSAFLAVRSVLPSMLAAGRGRIVLIGSSAVCDGGGGAIDYAAAKAGLHGMMAYLCRTYARRGVMANLIHPAAIETDLLKERYREDAARQKLAAQIPAGRIGRPEDIAALAAYLLSPWGDYLCGQEILADGGRTLYNK